MSSHEALTRVVLGTLPPTRWPPGCSSWRRPWPTCGQRRLLLQQAQEAQQFLTEVRGVMGRAQQAGLEHRASVAGRSLRGSWPGHLSSPPLSGLLPPRASFHMFPRTQLLAGLAFVFFPSRSVVLNQGFT